MRGRGTARPQSSYYGGSGSSEFNFNGGGGGGSSVRAESRVRSKSLAEPKQYNRDGRIILHYCKSIQQLIKAPTILTTPQLALCITMQLRFQRNWVSRRATFSLFFVYKTMVGGRRRQLARTDDPDLCLPTTCKTVKWFSCKMLLNLIVCFKRFYSSNFSTLVFGSHLHGVGGARDTLF